MAEQSIEAEDVPESTEDLAEDPASAKVDDKPAVKRTAMRPAGSIENVRTSIILGTSIGLLSVYVGIRCIQWALVRFLTGGSSTVLALTIMLPFTAPMLVSSLLINRGKKALGLSIGGGVLVAVLIAAAYFFLLHHEPAALQARPPMMP